jgi:hypothetical protein
MGLASLIFGGNTRTEFKDGTTGSAVLTIDATISSTHTSGAQLTQKELEKGSHVNDHMVTQPEGVILKGIVSETPLDLFTSLAGSAIGAAASLASQAGTGAAAAVGILGGSLLGAVNGSRSANAYEIMTQLQQKRVKFDLVTGLKSYKDMVITNVSAERSSQIGQAIQFTATITKITFVTSELISLGEANMLDAASGASNTNLGKQATSAAGDSTSSNGSILFNIFG